MQRDLSLRAVRFAIALAFNPASQWIALAQAAEQAGFESVVVSDHLIYPGELQSAYPYTDDGKPRWEQATAWPDPLIAVGAQQSAVRSRPLRWQPPPAALRADQTTTERLDRPAPHPTRSSHATNSEPPCPTRTGSNRSKPMSVKRQKLQNPV